VKAATKAPPDLGSLRDGPLGGTSAAIHDCASFRHDTAVHGTVESVAVLRRMLSDAFYCSW